VSGDYGDAVDMEIVVVHAHPALQSFNRVLFDTVCESLRTRHSVSAFDLYTDGFQPAMSMQERRAYETDDPIRDPLVDRYADAVRRADAMVFVYPTWWSGMPAMMKGWLEKVMVPGVAFGFDDSGKVKPRMQHVRRLAGVTTYGSPRWGVAIGADGGRRIVRRALRLSTGLRTRTTWLGLYSMDTSTPEQREAFRERVAAEFSTW
jgi:putative NADPH-quinone reductase